MKRQKLKLKVVDHRGDETTERVEVYDDDRKFLQMVGRVANTPDAHVSEQTATLIHLYSKDQIDAFKNPTDQADE
jgi:alpha-D-ribose 1-methylphosphonate 5-phosphate C-P lyase